MCFFYYSTTFIKYSTTFEKYAMSFGKFSMSFGKISMSFEKFSLNLAYAVGRVFSFSASADFRCVPSCCYSITVNSFI